MELIIDIINITLSSLNEKPYLLQLKKIISSMPNDDESDYIKKIKTLLEIITSKDISDFKEAIIEVDDLFTEEITSKINFKPVNYTSKYKQTFLNSLNEEKFINITSSETDKIQEMLTQLKTTKGKKAKERLVESIYDMSKELNIKLTSLKVHDSSMKSFIIDPNNPRTTKETLAPIIDESKKINNAVIKTFPAFDIATYGGIKAGTTTLIAAKPSGFKSGTLQNICIAASINNTPESFIVQEGRIPTIIYVSMENNTRQLYERHLAYFSYDEKIPIDVIKSMSDEKLAQYVCDLNVKYKLQLPIIYIDKVSEGYTTVSDIASIISDFEQLGYEPVLLCIDYLNHVTPDDSVSKNLSLVGAEGGKRKTVASHEIRRYAISKNIAVVIPEQLATDAVSILEHLRSDCRRIDPLYHSSMDMISGARNLSTEYDNVLFIYKSEITNIEQDSDTMVVKEYISFLNQKVRDAKTEYVFSPRDKANSALYDLQARKLKNGPMREKFKTNAMVHTVSPLHGFKIDTQDYAKSIIMYYPNDNTDSESLHDLMKQSRTSMADVDSILDESNTREEKINEINL